MVSRREKISQRNGQDRAVSPERIKKVNVEENKRYREECLKRGYEGSEVKKPQYVVNKTLFGGDQNIPEGSPSKWPDEDRQKQSIAKKRATDAIVEKNAQGQSQVEQISVEETVKAKQEIDRDGVDRLWDFLFGNRHVEEPKKEEQLDLFEQSISTGGENDAEESTGKNDKDNFKFFIFF